MKIHAAGIHGFYPKRAMKRAGRGLKGAFRYDYRSIILGLARGEAGDRDAVNLRIAKGMDEAWRTVRRRPRVEDRERKLRERRTWQRCGSVEGGSPHVRLHFLSAERYLSVTIFEREERAVDRSRKSGKSSLRRALRTSLKQNPCDSPDVRNREDAEDAAQSAF